MALLITANREIQLSANYKKDEGQWIKKQKTIQNIHQRCKYAEFFFRNQTPRPSSNFIQSFSLGCCLIRFSQCQ